MLRAFSTAATGMTAQQMMVDVIANNLANMNTNGFKRSQIDFQDLLYLQMRDPGTEVASGVNTPGGLEIGGGVHAAATIKVFTSGEFENTGRDLDMAIRGDGFLEVDTRRRASNKCQRRIGYYNRVHRTARHQCPD
jgi:flagellar basal-body rod protein FlgG